MRRRLLTTATALALAASALGLDGKNGYTSELLFTLNDATTALGSDFAGFTSFALFSPIGAGQGDGLAVDADGDVLFILQGSAPSDGSTGDSTALVLYDGSTFTNLVQDSAANGTGSRLQAVGVSPTDSGALSTGHPVFVRHLFSGSGGWNGVLDEVEIASVDPATGVETLLHAFTAGASNAFPARVAIDASGTSTDGTIYVGPMNDGTIARLTPSGTGYSEATLATSFGAGGGLLVDSTGALYTFAAGDAWHENDHAHEVYRLNPGTDVATSWATIPSRNWVYDWTFDAADGLWASLRDRKRRYVTDVPAGGASDVRDRIAESPGEARGLASGPDGTFCVMEGANLFGYGTVSRLTPSGDGGSSGGGNGKGKGKK